MARKTKKETVSREVEIVEETCDVTGELLGSRELGRKGGDVVHSHFVLRLELVSVREDGSRYTEAVHPEHAPVVAVGPVARLLGPKLLGELFPGRTFEKSGLGQVRRRKNPAGKDVGPEVG